MLHHNQPIKIALVGDCLSKGGAEKVQAILSNYLARNGFEVHNCVLIDAVTYQYSGSMLNLGKIKPNESSIIRKFYRFKSWINWVLKNDFDCLIDFRMRPSFTFEFLLSRIIYPHNTIYTVHSGVLDFYFPNNLRLAKILYRERKLVAVSNDINDLILNKFKFDTVHTIYNPIDFHQISVLKEEFQVDDTYILSIGSMDSSIKQIDKLILAYSKSNLPKQNIKLVILGDGKNRLEYQTLVENLELTHLVLFKGLVQNPFPFYKNSIFTVLSSRNEGLPNVLLESLACETPVVAFDCCSGPSEIIENYQNGILVEDQNFEKLNEAMNLMCKGSELYEFCKKNAASSVEKFSIEIIGKRWIEIIKS